MESPHGYARENREAIPIPYYENNRTFTAFWCSRFIRLFTLGHLYTFLASKSLEMEPTKVEVTIEEIQSHMGEKQKIDLAQSNQVELSVTQEEEIETLMAAILKRILSIHKIGEESPQYTTNVNNILNWINDNIYHYDNAVKVDVLRAFERVSKSFEQQTFMESAELFFELYNSKYQDIEALRE